MSSYVVKDQSLEARRILTNQIRQDKNNQAHTNMSTGTSGSDEKLSASKIQPLDSETKYNTAHDMSSRGTVGSDRNIDQARTEPVGGRGQYQHPAPKDDSQGVVGRDETVGAAKIEPLDRDAGLGAGTVPTRKNPGLDDEQVSGARVAPMGEVREESS